MQMNGQIYALAALIPEQEHAVYIG